jgi:hypothetical protein
VRARSSGLHSLFLVGPRSTEFEDVLYLCTWTDKFLSIRSFCSSVPTYLEFTVYSLGSEFGYLFKKLDNKLGNQVGISVHRL